MERPPGLPTSPPPPRVDSKPEILLRIYRDAAKPVDISGFATIEQATAAGNEWQGRLWWRVTIDGKIVAEEPKGVKR
jgi:hypothetical protein